MCGITGFISTQVSNPKEVMHSMIGTLLHRGPDNTSIWNDLNGVNMAHSRLSILDLSESGNQPILSKSGRYVMVFNGEIYNYQELKRKIDSLTNIQWSGSSDSEVLVELIDHFGIKEALIKCSPKLMEPIMDLEVVMPNDYLGAVMGDITKRRGTVKGFVPRGNAQVLTALVPLSVMFGYATDLRSLTQGRAVFTLKFSNYNIAPKSVQEHIIEKFHGRIKV